jgi:hypothetical protein
MWKRRSMIKANTSKPEAQPGSASLLSILPSFLWFALAVAALVLFAKPALKLLEQAQLHKVGVGIFEVEFAQQAVANIKEGVGIPKTAAEFKPIAERASAIRHKLNGAYVLWVDDKNPSQNVQERRALASFGINFDLASSTSEAFKWLESAHYDAVISNINRPGETDINSTPCFASPLPAGAGCVMAQRMHEKFGEDMPPVIFYSGRYPQSSGTPPFAFGVTNRVDRLFNLVFDALERRALDEAAR